MWTPNDARPLLVVGRQRAGTRFVADGLSSFVGVTIQGELTDIGRDRMVDLVDGVANYYSKRAASGDPELDKRRGFWEEKKRDLIYHCWYALSKDQGRLPDDDCRFYGYKRPGDEHLFDFYERHLGDQAPIYIYCCRNFRDNYLSIIARWPGRSIRRVAGFYLQSLRQFRYMKEQAPERVIGFVLDDLQAQGVEYFQKRVLDRLGIKPNRQIMRRLARKEAPNSAVRHGVEKRVDLSRLEYFYLAFKPDLNEHFEYVRQHG